jgi:ABC-type multidrug transport system fused ATPase/permease subunit
LFKDLRVEISTRNDALKQQQLESSKSRTPFTTAQLYRAQSWSLWHHTKICLRRQWAFTARSPEFVVPRFIQSVFMGLVMGSAFYQLGTGQNDFSPRIGLILFALCYTAFTNMSEVPWAAEFKLVVYKQVDAGFYSTFSYLFSVVLMHFPIAIIECGLLGSILYWMIDYVHDAGRFFFFLLLILCVNLAIGAIFRTLAYVTRNPDIAQNLANPITAIFFLFGGFLITADKIPNFLIWVFYLSPFSWGTRSGALNEFQSDRYDHVPGGGDTYLRVWQISTNSAYKWAGIGYLIGVFVLVVCLSALVLARKRSWLTVGTRREHAEEGHAQDAHGSSASLAALDSLQRPRVVEDVRIGMKTSSMVRDADAAQAREASNQLPFQRMDITFTNLNYTVTVPDEERPGKTRDRMLLQNVNGFARAGELTALMGSSGAGQ